MTLRLQFRKIFSGYFSVHVFFRQFRQPFKCILLLFSVFIFSFPKIFAHDQTLTYAKVLFSSLNIEIYIVVPKENISDIIRLKNGNDESIDTVFFIEYFKNHFEILNDHEKCIPEIKEVNFLSEVNSYSFVFDFTCAKTVNNLLITYNLFFEISEAHACIVDFILEDQLSEITFTKNNHSIEIPVGDLLKKWGSALSEKKDTTKIEKLKIRHTQIDSSFSFGFKKSAAPKTLVPQSKIIGDTIVKNPPTDLTDSVLSNQNKKSQQHVLVFEKQSWWQKGRSFFVLGIKHILTGYDHLLFLFGLLLISIRLFDVIKIVTSFTIAHSITLGIAALGIFVLPAHLTESLIALSVSYIAFENIFLMQKNFTPRIQRWLITFFFGLIHGFGFSSVLREIGLPKEGLITALLSFNVGIEIGQLSIVLLLLPLLMYIRKTRWSLLFIKVCSMIIGSFGIIWFFQRAFFF
jgi:hydrogenase/urease accessory protein HupE